MTNENGELTASKSLTELANLFVSDKGDRRPDDHRYTYIYDLLFYGACGLPINFLEIGLAVGGPELGGDVDRKVASPSIQMWLSYFSKAMIYGFDISDFSHMKHPRFTFFRGDSGKTQDLNQLIDDGTSYDIIIDDASHASYHQQLTLKTLFPSLRPGGLYIIEDLHWQSPYFENSLPKIPTTAVFFDKFFREQEYIENSLWSVPELEKLKSQVATYSLFNSYHGWYVPKMMIFRKG